MREPLSKLLPNILMKMIQNAFLTSSWQFKITLKPLQTELNLIWEFDFGFVCNYDPHELRYIGFRFELGMLQVSSGGSIYNRFVGSYSYTDWMYSIGLNGWDEGSENCNFTKVLELVRSGAKLTIEGPDEYNYYEEDE
ncbi:hypothetical protein [Neobacillus drentensis]|uniref:hypothetical protein n=1 Tax=Neobacillus drentensis TaxID=220684 RepID=UPI0030020051